MLLLSSEHTSRRDPKPMCRGRQISKTTVGEERDGGAKAA